MQKSQRASFKLPSHPLIIGIDLLIDKCWPSHVLLAALSLSLLGGDACCSDECTAAVRGFEEQTNTVKPNTIYFCPLCSHKTAVSISPPLGLYTSD